MQPHIFGERNSPPAPRIRLLWSAWMGGREIGLFTLAGEGLTGRISGELAAPTRASHPAP